MKKNNRGFTLIEILAVMFIIGLIMAIAVPSILNLSKRFKGEGIDAKLELIEKAAVNYAQSNSNKIKESLGNVCNSETSTCECQKNDKGVCEGNYKFKYIISIDKLIELGGYDAEQFEDDLTKCNVPDPRDKNMCLDSMDVKILLDDKYKTATAEVLIEK